MLNALITGASGSIGSALFQHLRARGATVTGIDRIPTPGVWSVDIRDRLALRRLFETIKPQVLFHAAALKHVPELESQPFAAVETNVFGTINVACAAREAGVPTVILLSTDKAVRPVSVMGKTKRMAEDIFQAIDSSMSHFVTVRFGNVLGSSGSVLPIFQEQIRRGGPVTVTHCHMERYFLSSDQAVLTLLEAATIGSGRDVLVPEMGQARSIFGLAQELIAGRNIPIEFTGIRPGEKLSEELWDPDRELFIRKQGNVSVYRLRPPVTEVWERVEALRRCLTARDLTGLLALLSDPPQENPEN